MSSATWPLAEHTRIKHEFLKGYLDAWFPILATGGLGSRRLVFIDGFAGPGRYEDGEPGSPVIAVDAVLNARIDLSGCEFVFLFVEADPDACAHLRGVVDGLSIPSNVKIYVQNAEFVEIAESILARLNDNGATLAPTLAMIDPFGFSGMPIDLISRLLAFDKCEVYFNFMADSYNRFARVERVQKHFEATFGSDEFLNVPAAGDAGRMPFLVDLYERALREVAGFNYVSRFRLINAKGRQNYLFHGTRHIKGLSVFRRLMWKEDPTGGEEYDVRTAAQPKLPVDLSPLARSISTEFAGRSVNLSEVSDYVLTGTKYDPSRHLKKETLKVIEQTGGITEVTKADGSKRRNGTFPDGCTIRFA